ncbi:MAG: 16S rRNA (adenine(1518)-N(6)/adenine(1519)-N(6))-dimethyltransferase RsmA [Brevinema sp.]
MSYDPFGIQNIKSLLNDNGLYLSKNRGQNYLINRSSAEKIVNAAPDLQEGQQYFEVGTGLGALTVILAERGKTISLEIDKGVHQLVHSKFSHPNLEHIHGDFLQWSDYPKTGEYIFISNLPYSISGEAIKHIIEHDIFKVGILMLQKEFADRMEASIASSNYGPLSVIVQNFLKIEKLFFVGKGNFFPEPKVDSLVIKITKKETTLDQAKFAQFIKACFHAKRKTLSNNLANSPWKDDPITQDPICKKRPDAITPEEWLDLFQRLETNT